jgi:hypothetical protein
MIEQIKHLAYVEYVLDGQTHRPTGPAVVWDYGLHSWFLFGVRHRYYGSGCSWNQSWYIHGGLVK